jgi:hypothetical protein
MRYLAHRKIVIADKLGSRALRADAMEAVTCGWLSHLWSSSASLLDGLLERGESMAARGGLMESPRSRLYGFCSRKPGGVGWSRMLLASAVEMLL